MIRTTQALTRTTGILAASVAAIVLAATPVHAASLSRVWSGNEVQVDHDPGSGFNSWLWVWDGDADARGVFAEVHFQDGTRDKVWDSNGADNDGTARNYTKEIDWFRLCQYYNDSSGGVVVTECSNGGFASDAGWWWAW